MFTTIGRQISVDSDEIKPLCWSFTKLPIDHVGKSWWLNRMTFNEDTNNIKDVLA